MNWPFIKKRFFWITFSYLFLVLSPRVHAVTSADYYRAGLQLYNAKNYSLAVRYFGAAISLDPNNMSAYQGRANCEYTLGDKQSALADYQKVQSVRPNPQLGRFIQSLQAQLGAQPPLPNLAAVLRPQKKDMTFSDKYDVRITFGASTLSLKDFQNNANELVALGKYYQSLDYTPSYSGSVPDGFAPMLGIEVSQRFTPDVELGVLFNYVPVGTVTNDFQLPNPDGLPVTLALQDSYNINAFMAGLQARYTLMHGDFRPFVSGGLVVVGMQMNFSSNDTYINSSTDLVNETLSGSFSALGFGGLAQVGVDWDLGEGFAVSPSVGYQFASASDFQATVNSSSSGVASQGQTVTLDVVRTDFGSAIEPVTNGNVMRVVYQKSGPIYPGSAAPNSTPMTVDLSGLRGILQISYNF